MSTRDLPATAAVGRVALRVADLASVADFYETVVGLERLDRSESGAAAGADGDANTTDADTADADTADPGTDAVVLGAGETPLLRLFHDPDAPERDPRAAGLYHTAFRVPNRAALGSAIERLRGANRLEGAADHLVSEAVYASDPEGNGVEVYADRPREEWTFVRAPENDRDDESSEPDSSTDRVRIDTLPLDLDALVANSDGAERAPAGTDVGHVHLEVTDLSEAWRFYVDALGTNVRETLGDEALFVAAGDYHHHVGLNTWQRRDRPAGGASAFADGAERPPGAASADGAEQQSGAASADGAEQQSGVAPTDAAEQRSATPPADGAERPTRGLAWFEFTLPDRDALDAATARLLDAGYDVATPAGAQEGGASTAVVRDPDEIELRLRVASS